jgi:hypothetical protein
MTLGRHELEVIQGAIAAHGLVRNAHFLPSPGRQKAARRLVERGLVTDVSDGFVSYDDPPWIVVKIDQAQLDRVHAALREPKP